MDFSLNDEQQMIVKTTRDFVVNELYPHEKEVEETGVLREDLHHELKAKAIEAGLYAANMPAEVGGAGLDTVSWVLYEKELGRANYALHWSCVGRPSNILLACEGEQRERYLLPTVRGERVECLAMTEPGAGSDLRGMKTSAVESGGDFVINGTKHFISHADHSDYVILFAASGEEAGRARYAQENHLVLDRYGPSRLRGAAAATRTCRIAAIPTASSSSTIAACRRAPCWGRCIADSRWRTNGSARLACRWRPRASDGPSARSSCAKQWAVDRVQFGQQIGKFQGVSFKLADMAVELRAAELLVLEAAWKHDRKIDTEMDMAIAKLKATEMLAMVADEALQIHGGMGLMTDLPLERIWRDARIERIWDGTSEVQRHIISRALLRPLGG